MKKVFVVRRTDSIDWDEYDSCVVVADSIEEVEAMINSRKTGYWDTGEHNREIIEINLETCESMELVASFNAG